MKSKSVHNKWSWLLLVFHRVDAVYGATSWSDALSWLGYSTTLQLPWTLVQVWCHGRPGQVIIGNSTLTTASAVD